MAIFSLLDIYMKIAIFFNFSTDFTVQFANRKSKILVKSFDSCGLNFVLSFQKIRKNIFCFFR